MHKNELLVGITGAVAVKLLVYMKGKNAKKFRQGVEYGSARWGTAKDIAPFIDPVFENNILLTMTERLTMNGRPKNPKFARNKNVIVIGGSGSGKTRFYVKRCKPCTTGNQNTLCCFSCRQFIFLILTHCKMLRFFLFQFLKQHIYCIFKCLIIFPCFR